MPYGIVRLIDRRQPAIFTALPPTAFLLRKNSAGLFDEGKSDDDKEESRRNTCVFQGSMTQSALICAWGPPQGRKTLWGEEDAPQRGGLPVRGSTTEAKVASDEKACVSLSREGSIPFYIYPIPALIAS